MDSIDAQFKTMPRPTGKVVVPVRRKLSKFELWAWSPVVSFRIGLTASYFALIYFGVSALISTPPSIDATTPEGYAGFWAVAMIVGAVAAAFGSVGRTRLFERIETLGSSLLTLTLGSYALIVLWIAYGTGDETRVAGAAGFVALAIPIIIRFMWLLSQLRRK